MPTCIRSLMLLVTAWTVLNGQAAPQPGDPDYAQPSPSARHDQKVAAVSSGHYDLVLIGDSITHTLQDFGGKYDPLNAVWAKHYAPRHAINLGHNGYRTEQILWNLQNGELDFQESPEVFLLLIGTNNADSRNFPRAHTPEQILAGTKAIVDLIRHRHPTSKILILRLFPKGRDAQRSEGVSPPIFAFGPSDVETARRAGALTKQLADNRHVFWLDINHVFLRPNGTIDPEMMWDLLHPSPVGAEAWAQAVIPTIDRLMGATPAPDARPVSVIPIPRRDDSYDWNVRHEAALKAKATNPQFVFIGDSITHHLGGPPAATGPFLDLAAKFLDANGNLPASLMPDFLHPNAAGYKIWAEAVVPEIKTLLNQTSQRRPLVVTALLGNARTPKNPFPGPFEAVTDGKQEFRVWPKHRCQKK